MENPLIQAAFSDVDRSDFVPEEFRSLAYDDAPLPIGAGQTISQPYTVAFMLDLLDPRPGDKILDIGSGSGYTTALLASIAGKNGRVIGLEKIPSLVLFGQKNIAKYNLKTAVIQPAGRDIGLSEESPFDRILVSAAAESLPEKLINQLKEGGVLVIPVRDEIWRVKKLEGRKTEIKKWSGFAFVPLVE